VLLALCAGGLALTHYWCLYLLLTVGAWLVLVAMKPQLFASRSRHPGIRVPDGGVDGDGDGDELRAHPHPPPHPARGPRRHRRDRGWRGRLRPLAGRVLLPAFVHRTPWGEPASFAAISHAYGQWSGGPTTQGRLLLFVVTGLVAAGIAGRAIDGRFIMIDLRGIEPGRTLFLLATMTLVVAVAAGKLVGNAWADRYTATAFVPFLLVVGLGATALVNQRVFRSVVLAAAVIGLAAGAGDIRRERTQANEAAEVLAQFAKPGDVLLVCPDQLGPGLARTVPSWLKVRIVPTYEPPDRVNWVDYEDPQRERGRQRRRRPGTRRSRAGRTVFLAGSGSYRTYEELCTAVRGRLEHARSHADQLLEQGLPTRVYENFAVLRFPPS
jgi:hypothetical protein